MALTLKSESELQRGLNDRLILELTTAELLGQVEHPAPADSELHDIV